MAVHLLTGDDDLLLQRALSRLIAELTDADPDLTIDVHDASELTALPSLRTDSLFGDRRGVAIRGLEAKSGVAADLKTEIQDYLAAPDPDGVLLLVARGLGNIQAIARVARKVGDVHEHKLPADWSKREWSALALEEFRLVGRVVSADAVAAIQRHAGTDLTTIASQVAQVVASTPGDATITAIDVDSVIQGHGQVSAFTLVDAVVERDVELALETLRGLMAARESPVAIFGAMANRFRQLLAIRGGASQAEAQVRSTGQYNRLKGLARRNFSAGELGWCQDRLARLDVDLKGGSPLDPAIVLEMAVIDLAIPRQVGPDFNPTAFNPTA